MNQRVVMTPHQMETYIQQLLQNQNQQNQTQAQQDQLINKLQTSIDTLNTQISNLIVTSGSGASGANVFDTYQVGGGILHKLITTFANAVNFSLTILVTGIATFTAAPVLSALTASLPLQLTAGKAITSALINLTSAVTGILPRANGGLGNGVVTAYVGTITSGAAAAGTFSGTITGTADLVTGAVSGTCSGTTSSATVTGNTSTNV